MSEIETGKLADVIELRPKPKRDLVPGVIRRSRKGREYCMHQPAIDPNAREVWCIKCEAPLDPIDQFLRFAAKGEEYLHMVHATNELRKEVEALKAERSRLKQQVKRAGGGQ